MNSGRFSARKEEALIVKRRNAEVEHQQLWDGVTQYFKSWHVHANKYSAWTSPQYYLHNANTQLKTVNEEKKRQLLDERRKKLGAFLMHENEEFESELKTLNAKKNTGLSNVPMQDLIKINLELKRKSEEARKREAELKLYHHWSFSQPSVRDYQRHLNTRFVKQAWFDQMRERQEEIEKSQREEIESARRKEKERAELELREKEEEARKRELALVLQEQLREQIQELKAKEKESEELKKEEANELFLRDQLEELAFQRRLGERKRKDQEHRVFLTHQYEQKLKRRSSEVIQELEEEKKNLDSIMATLSARCEKEELQKQSALRNLMAYNKMLSEQVAKERAKEKEYNNTFSIGEARNMWEMQEVEWKKEVALREGLARDVFDGVKRQLEERVKSNLQSQLCLVQHREELLGKLEETKQKMEFHSAKVNPTRQSIDDGDQQLMMK